MIVFLSGFWFLYCLMIANPVVGVQFLNLRDVTSIQLSEDVTSFWCQKKDLQKECSVVVNYDLCVGFRFKTIFWSATHDETIWEYETEMLGSALTKLSCSGTNNQAIDLAENVESSSLSFGLHQITPTPDTGFGTANDEKHANANKTDSDENDTKGLETSTTFFRSVLDISSDTSSHNENAIATPIKNASVENGTQEMETPKASLQATPAIIVKNLHAISIQNTSAENGTELKAIQIAPTVILDLPAGNENISTTPVEIASIENRTRLATSKNPSQGAPTVILEFTTKDGNAFATPVQIASAENETKLEAAEEDTGRASTVNPEFTTRNQNASTTKTYTAPGENISQLEASEESIQGAPTVILEFTAGDKNASATPVEIASAENQIQLETTEEVIERASTVFYEFTTRNQNAYATKTYTSPGENKSQLETSEGSFQGSPTIIFKITTENKNESSIASHDPSIENQTQLEASRESIQNAPTVILEFTARDKNESATSVEITRDENGTNLKGLKEVIERASTVILEFTTWDKNASTTSDEIASAENETQFEDSRESIQGASAVILEFTAVEKNANATPDDIGSAEYGTNETTQDKIAPSDDNFTLSEGTSPPVNDNGSSPHLFWILTLIGIIWFGTIFLGFYLRNKAIQIGFRYSVPATHDNRSPTIEENTIV